VAGERLTLHFWGFWIFGVKWEQEGGEEE